MEAFEAKFLLENLVARIEEDEAGKHHLPGVLTHVEMQAMQVALRALDDMAALPIVEAAFGSVGSDEVTRPGCFGATLLTPVEGMDALDPIDPVDPPDVE